MIIDLRFVDGKTVLTERNLCVHEDRSSIVDFSVTSGDPFTAEVWRDTDGVVVAFRRNGWEGESARWRFLDRERTSWGKAELLYNTTNHPWKCQFRLIPARRV